MTSIEQVRELFPITSKRAFLITGSLSPAAAPAREAMVRWIEGWTNDPYDHYERFWEELDLTRQSFARVIGADPSEIAVTDASSRGSNLAVQMIDAPQGSNVVMDRWAYPSGIFPWRLPAKSHVEVRYVPARDNIVHLEDIATAVDDRTVAVNVTHVSTESGFRHDLAAVAEIAHAHGAYLIVDGSLSVGAVDIDVKRMGVDFLTTTTMKWLLGSPGVGFLYVPARYAEQVSPPQAGYTGVERSFAHDLEAPVVFRPASQRFEIGMPNLPGLCACREGVEILLSVGIKKIEEYVVGLTGRCIEGLLSRDVRVLTPLDPRHRAGAVAISVPGSQELHRFLRDRAVDVGTDRVGLIRIDVHVYNNTDDIDHLLKGLDEYAKIHGRSALRAEPDTRTPWVSKGLANPAAL